MAVVTNLDRVHLDVIDIMERHYGNLLNQIVLFGSYARGDFNEESDVDYLVVLDEENVSSFKEITTTIADRNAYFDETSITISAVVVSKNQFLSSNRIFYRQVRKDGKCIYERGSRPLYQ
ncbi:nucleotidyltransferase domain-containing protein [Spirosoma utsteinense]|uniref:Nucleotidyltransferase n=1 Tax=Spirosoma utsteinense TaxID=2585773 RepID=A0ABR6W4L1_9BACT|nr:nucleotidyltransferase domain-containing protein [Spirosoma utsteinense]MBC3785431.1 putative nucleotidyltransferase [Spirosoma utsteinense]MBC3791541.1 putative nucleotidyltransferase [Spirosoma utsteinense]